MSDLDNIVLSGLRGDWLRHRRAGRDREARLACAVAVDICRDLSCPLPEWLNVAIAWHLLNKTADDRRRISQRKTDVRRALVLLDCMGDAETAVAAHFEAAANRLNEKPSTVSKFWQRHRHDILSWRKAAPALRIWIETAPRK